MDYGLAAMPGPSASPDPPAEPQARAEGRSSWAGAWLDRVRARAARADAEPQVVNLARRMRRRLPGDEQLGDRLSAQGSDPVALIVRGVSALGPKRPSVAHEAGLGALQVWQALSEASGRGFGDRLAAVLFVDLIGFSSWALEAGDTATVELLRAVGTAVEGAIEQREGRMVKRLGDGAMAVFTDVTAAVEAGLDAQATTAEVELGGYRPRLRAGVHWGRPRRLGGDYLGVDVNIAARVVDAAKDDGVLVSDAASAELDHERFRLGRARRLRASGAPRELRVRTVRRA